MAYSFAGVILINPRVGYCCCFRWSLWAAISWWKLNVWNVDYVDKTLLHLEGSAYTASPSHLVSLFWIREWKIPTKNSSDSPSGMQFMLMKMHAFTFSFKVMTSAFLPCSWPWLSTHSKPFLKCGTLTRVVILIILSQAICLVRSLLQVQ